MQISWGWNVTWTCFHPWTFVFHFTVSCVLFRSYQRHQLDQQKHIQMCLGLRVLQKIHTHTHTGGALTDGFLLSESNVTLWRIQASCISSGWILHKAFGKLSSYEFEVVFLSVFVAMCLSIFVRVFFAFYMWLCTCMLCVCVWGQGLLNTAIFCR